jgi:hypothetical protein
MVLTIVEYIALALTTVCVYLIWRIYAVTHAKTMFLLAAGYVWWCILKIGLVARVDLVVNNKGVLSAGIGAFMALGLWLFLRVLRKSYNGGTK